MKKIMMTVILSALMLTSMAADRSIVSVKDVKVEVQV